jgi:ZIP family zinc transporter
MGEAVFWGFVGGAALLLGAAVAVITTVPKRVVGIIMAFGAGVLISALAFELTDEAYRVGGADAVAGGLAAGALVYWGANRLLQRRSGGGGALGITIGAVLDGIPESAAIGLTVLNGSVSAALVAAVFLSNIPESLSASTEFRAKGRPAAWILGLWGAVAAVSALAAGVGYVALDGAGGNLLGGIQAFAGGAILVMLVDTMIPEAFVAVGERHGRPADTRFERRLQRNQWLGLVTTLGFALAYLLSTLE